MPRTRGSISRSSSGPIRRRPGTPFAAATLLEVAQPRHLGLVGGDDHLAAALVADPMLVTEGVHPRHPVDAQLRLQRAGLVVDPGVDDARVRTCLVASDVGLALEHGDAELRAPPQEFGGGREAEDPAPDDGQVDAIVHKYEHGTVGTGSPALIPARTGRVAVLPGEGGPRWQSIHRGVGPVTDSRRPDRGPGSVPCNTRPVGDPCRAKRGKLRLYTHPPPHKHGGRAYAAVGRRPRRAFPR